MFGGNFTTIEFRLVADPESSDRADVVNANAFMTQGKREDDKKPMFFKLAAWKYSGRVLASMGKGKLYIATGRFSMDWWGDNKEKSGLVFTAEDFAEKLFAPQDGQQPQNGYQNQGNNQQGYQNQQQGIGMQGEYDPNLPPLDSSDIPF